MDYQKVAELLEKEYTRSTHAGHDTGIVDKGFMAGFAACLDVMETKEPEPIEARTPTVFNIRTGMGAVNGGDSLYFLDSYEKKELDSIGYSGKLLDGTKMSRAEYLNSLNKGKFIVQQTGFDNGDFSEAFTIARSE